MRRSALLAQYPLGIKNLLLHKLRSLLTMLGVVFGVGSVIAMLAVGEGASKEALEQIRKLGSHNIIVDLGQADRRRDRRRAQRVHMSIYGLLYEDEARIGETMPAVRRTVPVKLIRKDGRLGERSLELRIVGTTPGLVRSGQPRGHRGARALRERLRQRTRGVSC